MISNRGSGKGNIGISLGGDEISRILITITTSVLQEQRIENRDLQQEGICFIDYGSGDDDGRREDFHLQGVALLHVVVLTMVAGQGLSSGVASVEDDTRLCFW